MRVTKFVNQTVDTPPHNLWNLDLNQEEILEKKENKKKQKKSNEKNEREEKTEELQEMARKLDGKYKLS